MVKFGTSGLRGLARDLTEPVVATHVAGFLRTCDGGSGLWIGRDLRDSSPRIATAVITAACAMGVPVTDCGVVPTPALALAAQNAGASAVMITGSHIPADRNGLKFYTPGGEITKADETAILASLAPPDGSPRAEKYNFNANSSYLTRAHVGFGHALAGLRIVLWSHAAAGRDLLAEALRQAGAEVTEVGRADSFVAVDTEAVDDDTRAQLAEWVRGADALVSTDGDGDRPLLTDAEGTVVPGDILGQITAAALGAEVVVTPVSSNTGVEAGARFARVIRTAIGSPHVIAGMEAAPGRTIGYEANGGVLLGFEAQGPAGPLPPLATRDSLLPILATLAEARRVGSVAARVAQEPARVTVTDRLQDVPRDRMEALMAEIAADPAAHLTALTGQGTQIAHDDRTDGLRLTLTDGRILHLRPSGNAPELRFYVETGDQSTAAALSARIRAALQARL